MGRPHLFFLLTALAALSEQSPLEVAGVIARSESDLLVHKRPISTRSQHARRQENTFDLNQSWDNQVIFNSNNGLNDLLVNPLPAIIVTCVKCCTSGTITAAINDDDILEPKFRVDMRDVSALIDVDISASGAATFAIPLLPSPAGFLTSLIRGVEADLGFTIDLVFDMQAGLDVRGGFAVDFPDDIFFEAGLFDGVMGDLSFDGIQAQSLPFQINLDGTQTFTVSLQLQVAVGLAITDAIPLIDISAGASVGAFVNLVQFVAELESTPECLVQSSESANLNIGLFGGASVDIGPVEFEAVPEVSTTLFEVDFGTQCLVPIGAPIVPKPAPVVSTECAIAPPTASGLGHGMPTTHPDAGGFIATTLTDSPKTTVHPDILPVGHPPALATAQPHVLVTVAPPAVQPLPIHPALAEPAPFHPAPPVHPTQAESAPPMHPTPPSHPAPMAAQPAPHAMSVARRDSHSPTLPPLGHVTVMIAKVCATPVINCPASEVTEVEMMFTICPPAMMTPSVCFAANATNMVPHTSPSPRANATISPVQSSRPSAPGAVFATVWLTNATVTTAGFFPPTVAPSAPTALPITGPVTVSAGHRIVGQTWNLCSVSLALVAIVFMWTL